VLPPARSGDLLAVLSSRPLAIALVDGLFETEPSVWHHEILESLEAGVAVFGGGSLGALRAAELDRHGMVGVGMIFRWVKAGRVEDDAEVALLHAPAEWGFRPLTVPLVAVRAAADQARARRVLRPSQARALVLAAQALHFTERTWERVLGSAPLGAGPRRRFLSFLPSAPDPKEADARATVLAAAAYVRARRTGAPSPPPPGRRPSSHLRHAKLRRSVALLPDGRALDSAAVLDTLQRRPDAGRMAADGLRRALLVALARSAGLSPAPGEGEEALATWLARLGVPAARREAYLSACAIDGADARRLGEDLALEAEVLRGAAAFAPDGPSWEEGLALGARLCGAFAEEAARAAAPLTPARPPRTRAGRPTGATSTAGASTPTARGGAGSPPPARRRTRR
jgi:hypothetical protein